MEQGRQFGGNSGKTERRLRSPMHLQFESGVGSTQLAR
jgi:hypothetical protein